MPMGSFNNATTVLVLIESDWNLNDDQQNSATGSTIVLIESDWNLNIIQKASSMWTTRY